MSKAARKRKHDSIMQAKKARKEQKRALYKSYSEHGRANRLKKVGGNQTSAGYSPHDHNENCGNVGCIRCYPQLNNTQKGNGQFRLPDYPVKLYRTWPTTAKKVQVVA